MGSDTEQGVRPAAPVGFSGAKIEYKGPRVLKTSRDKDCADRLAKAAEKQEWLRKHLSKEIGVPQVTSVTYDSQARCVVSMESVYGLRLEDWITKNQPSHVETIDLAVRLADIVKQVAAVPLMVRTTPVVSESQFIAGKLKSVRDHLTGQYRRSSQASLQRFIIHCDRWEPFQDQVEPTFCHGDLAFDNILVDKDGKFWLLDCLDQPFDHTYCDVAKVLQSTHVDWPAIRSGRLRNCLMYTTKEPYGTLTHTFLSALGITWHNDPRVSLYLALCLARIVPYAPTWQQQRVLLDIVNQQLDFYRKAR